jgi:hypothetical protein
MSLLRRAALAYAALLDWPVLPLRARSKQPLCPHGFRDATTDQRTIERWWDGWPDANVGIACTEASDLVTLDIDPRHHGDVNLDELEERFGALPQTVEAQTGGGGRHLVFRRPKGVRLRATLCPGVDIKADGYIVAPPSVHPTGRRYEWEASSRPGERTLAELPPWVVALAVNHRSPPRGDAAIADDAATSFLARAFAAAGWLGRRLDGTRIAARCPWQDEHTGGERGAESSTVIFAPRDGSCTGWFHCSHTSHGPKNLRDVLAVLPVEAAREAASAMVEAAARVEQQGGT